MKMSNMAMSAKEKKAMTGSPTASAPEALQYPYGLQIDLGDESIRKLGMDELPAVGSVLMLHAKVTVSRTNQSEESDGKKRQNLGLQITELALMEMEDEDGDSDKLLKRFYKDT